MDLQYIRKVVKIVTDSGIDELEIEQEGQRVRVTRTMGNSQPLIQQYPMAQPAAYPSAPLQQALPSTASLEKSVEASPSDESRYHNVVSPIVGTFYRAPAPDAEPYVQVGQSVSKGTPICIIEAMKIMNEIESDASGKVVKILVENGQPVEYNQPLFLIDPSA